MKPISKIMIEASVVGVCLIGFYLLANKLRILSNLDCKDMCLYVDLLVAGALFHIVFEYTGVNKWYSIDYINTLNVSNKIQ